MTCRVCGVLTSSVNIPGKPDELCVKHWAIESREKRLADARDRFIAEAKEQPEPSYLAEEGPFGDPERDLGAGE